MKLYIFLSIILGIVGGFFIPIFIFTAQAYSGSSELSGTNTHINIDLNGTSYVSTGVHLQYFSSNSADEGKALTTTTYTNGDCNFIAPGSPVIDSYLPNTWYYAEGVFLYEALWTGSCTLPADDVILFHWNGTYFAYVGTTLPTAAVNGCIDWTATNYNPIATHDDGSCLYSGLAPTIYIPATCSWNDFGTWGGCISNVLHDVFMPSSSSLAQFNGLYTTYANKPPFGYITAIQTQLREINDTGTSIFTLFSLPVLNTYIFTPLRVAFTWIFWLGFAFLLFKRFKDIQL